MLYDKVIIFINYVYYPLRGVLLIKRGGFNKNVEITLYLYGYAFYMF